MWRQQRDPQFGHVSYPQARGERHASNTISFQVTQLVAQRAEGPSGQEPPQYTEPGSVEIGHVCVARARA